MQHIKILTHLAAAAIVTILSALVYVAVQQAYRSTANDPQLQIAGDIGSRLKSGGTIKKWFDDDTIEISQSLSVFNTLYNDRKEPVLSSGMLNGKMPSLPQGVFDFAKKYGQNVFTWQPERGVRMAVVLQAVQAPSYSFVAVGRSLYEIEKREQNHLFMTLVSWLLCMGVILFHRLVVYFIARKSVNQ